MSTHNYAQATRKWRSQGWTITKGKTHAKLTHPAASMHIRFSVSPSCRWWQSHTEKLMRKALAAGPRRTKP